MEQSSAVSSQPSADETILSDAGFYWREREAVKVLVSGALEGAGFVNGFSTRVGGVSPFPECSLNLAGFKDDVRENIYENRRRFLAALGTDRALALAFQVHGDNILKVDSPRDATDSDIEADAVISDAEHVLAGVKTADCVPVLLADPSTRAFAAIHAGWRGTVQSIVAKAVAEMQGAYGADPQNMIAAIGPAASCRMYEVGQDVIDQFAENLGGSQQYFIRTRNGHAFVDLHNANRDQLIKAQVRPENIYVAPLCTMERSDLFFSYRREKQDFGRTGRLLSVIGRR
ncbi:MAG: peptidoglycan editing factor PgeF [Pyrinomonadaceae bacterium]